MKVPLLCFSVSQSSSSFEFNAVTVPSHMQMASNADAKKQHVHSCSLVRGKKFYGFHPNEQLFIKIVLYPVRRR